jgi:hypothetical protein
VADLCPHCALCCNGVIFGDVELQSDDDADRLRELGVPLVRRGQKLKFNQPCACLEGKLCRIYNDRPARCRAFDCRLLQRVRDGKVRVADARRIIQETLRHAATVRQLVHKLGQGDESLSLSKRYRHVMQQPIDLSAGEEIPRLRGQLMLAVHELTQLLERDFLT